MLIEVKKLIGENAITREAGGVVYNAVCPVLAQGQMATLDFSGVEIFASPFFNAAIGQLYRDFSSDELQRLLCVRGLTSAGRATLKVVISTAKSVYGQQSDLTALEESVRAAIDEESFA